MDTPEALPWITTVLGAIAAIWVWYTKSYLPAQQERERDEREDRQKREGDAFIQVVALNEKLVDDKIETTNTTLLRIEQKLDAISGRFQRLETAERINRKEWERSIQSIDNLREQVRGVGDALRKRNNV